MEEPGEAADPPAYWLDTLLTDGGPERYRLPARDCENLHHTGRRMISWEAQSFAVSHENRPLPIDPGAVAEEGL